MAENIRELYRFRELLLSWTKRELRLRYKQSLLGGVWAILQPLVLMVLFVLVFSIFVRLPTDGIPYPIFAYTGLLPWMYFSTSISFGVPSLVNNLNLVTKIYFPREILPLASIGVALVDFLIASCLLIFMMLYYKIPFLATLAWIPVLLVVQTVFLIGSALLFSMLNAFYRDFRFIVPLGLQVMFYATPIIYPLRSVPDWLRPIYILNPMAGIIDSYRRVILHGLAPEPIAFGVACCVSVLMIGAGYLYFKKSEGILPDVI